MDEQQYRQYQQQLQYEEDEAQLLSKFLLDSRFLLENISHTLLGEVLVEERVNYNNNCIVAI